MPSLQKSKENVPGVSNETIVNHGKLNVKEAIKAGQHEKPRLYKKVQNILSTVKSSLAEDIIEARND